MIIITKIKFYYFIWISHNFLKSSKTKTLFSGSSFSEQAEVLPIDQEEKKKSVKKVRVKSNISKPVKNLKSVPTSIKKSIVVPKKTNEMTYLVQLAATRSSKLARKEWERLKGRHIDLLGRLSLTINKVDLGSGKGIFYRLRAGPLGDESKARELCKILAKRQVGCLMVKPKK